jgi:hypothetical protein
VTSEQITVKDAFQLVGASAFADWILAERFVELEQAAQTEKRPTLIFSTEVDAPFMPRTELDRANEQYGAVARWMSNHGFSATVERYDLAALKKAMGEDPLRPAPVKRKRQRKQATDTAVVRYVKAFVEESKAANRSPKQGRLWEKAKSEDFKATRERLFDELDRHAVPIQGRPKNPPK